MKGSPAWPRKDNRLFPLFLLCGSKTNYIRGKNCIGSFSKVWVAGSSVPLSVLKGSDKSHPQHPATPPTQELHFLSPRHHKKPAIQGVVQLKTNFTTTECNASFMIYDCLKATALSKLYEGFFFLFAARVLKLQADAPFGAF